MKELINIADQHNFTICRTDFARPWGGFVELDKSDISKFIDTYFPGLKINAENVTPKFLLVLPGKRLSWQRHSRRAEYWHVVKGPVGIKISDTDDEPVEATIMAMNDNLYIPVEVRHRLIGLQDIGIVAEIWSHTDANNRSDESDIVRISVDS